MRAANEVFAEDSYFNSSETQFHQDMLDQQMSLELTSGRGLGLADALYAQMQRAYGTEARPLPNNKGIEFDPDGKPQPVKSLNDVFYRQQLLAAFGDGKDSDANPSAMHTDADASMLAYAQAERAMAMAKRSAPELIAKGGKASIAGSPSEFIAALKPYAEKAAAELNVNADVLLAQAALETGWGKHVIHTPSGNNSFNLFNIKADGRWQGDSVNVNTLEYRQGVATQERADFRRYDNYAESFADYVNFLQTNPRYRQALEVGVDSSAYAEALQDAGYATDPAYADKIKSLLGSDPIRAAAETLVAIASDTNET
jgi:flagellar protein FlgJ